MITRPCLDHGRTKSLSPGGYALVWDVNTKKMVRMHRLEYCKFNNISLSDIESLVIRHKCDNPRCVEPSHLEVGLQLDNMRDREDRGRGKRPNNKNEANGRAKLTM